MSSASYIVNAEAKAVSMNAEAKAVSKKAEVKTVSKAKIKVVLRESVVDSAYGGVLTWPINLGLKNELGAPSGALVCHKYLKRAERDERQRQVVAYRKKFGMFSNKFSASEIKDHNERVRTKLRDKRNPAFSGFLSQAELQSGPLVAASALAGAAMVKIYTGLRRVLRKSETLLDDTQGILNAVRSAVNSFKKQVVGNFWLVPVLVVFWFVLNKARGPIIAVLLSILSALLGPKIWDRFSKYFPQGGVKAQAGNSGVGNILASAFAFSVFKSGGSERNFSEFLRRVSSVERTGAGFDALVDWTQSALNVLIDHCGAYFGRKRGDFFKKSVDPIVEWAKSVENIRHKATTESLCPSDVDELVRMHAMGCTFATHRWSREVMTSISKYLVMVEGMLAPYVGSLSARNNFRCEPLACCLRGNPGIGKTVLTQYCCMSVLVGAGLIEPEDYKKAMSQVWAKGVSQYWEGYSGQLAIVVDDAFQKRVVTGAEEDDYNSIIDLVSSFACPLNFANLNSKGKVYFLSKFIMMTTNVQSISMEAARVLNDPRAVVRRIAFPYEIKPRDEYLIDNVTGMKVLDLKAFDAEFEKCVDRPDIQERFPWHVWVVRKYDYDRGQPLGAWQPMNVLIEEMIDDMKSRVSRHEKSETLMERFIRGPTLQSGSEIASEEMLIEGFDFDATLVEQQVDGILKRPELAKKADEILGCCWRVLRKNMLWELEDFFQDQSAWYLFFKGMRITAFWTLLSIAVCALMRSLFGVLSSFFSFLVKPFVKKKSRERNNEEAINLESNRNVVGMLKGGKVKTQSYGGPIVGHIADSTYSLSLLLDKSFIPLGSVTFVHSNLAYQPAHFTAKVEALVRGSAGQVKEDSLMTLTYNGMLPRDEKERAVIRSYDQKFTVKEYLSLRRYNSVRDPELEFIAFPTMRAHRNNTSHFLLEKDLDYIGGLPALVMLHRVGFEPSDIARVPVNVSNIRKVLNVPADTITIKRAFQYRADTYDGDCGSPVLLLDGKSYCGRQNFGMHVAGDRINSLGYCIPVVQEDIQEATKHLEVVTDKSIVDLAESAGIKLQISDERPFVNMGSILPIGIVDRAINLPSKTKLYPTSCYGKWGDCEYAPAHMRRVKIGDEYVYPMEQALKPYMSPVFKTNFKHLDQAMYVAMRRFNEYTAHFPRMLLTNEQAVVGIPELKFRSIPRSTSAGFPYCLDMTNGKKNFFGEGVDYDCTSDDCIKLFERVDTVIESAKRNERLSHVYADFLKDELRSYAKREAVATRLISSAPLDYTIAWRRYFGAFSSAMFRVNTMSGMAPGICTFSDWDKLVMELRSHGSRCFDGDFKGFDSSLQPDILMLCLKAVNQWYALGETAEEAAVNSKVREVLWLDLIHSRHITGLGNDQRYLVQWNKCLPSGHPFTSIVNSMYSLFVLVSCYIELTGDLTGFWNHVFSVTYGDDNVSNVDDETSQVFNQVTVSETVERLFGMKYTSADKTGELYETRPLEEMSFLKRGFRFEDNFACCPLEIDSFLYVPYWCKNKKLEREIIIDTLENALEELSMWPQDIWDKYSVHIIKEMSERGHQPRCYPYKNQYLTLIRSRTDNWY